LGHEAQRKLIHVQNLVDRHVTHLRLSGIMLEHSYALRPTDEEFEKTVRCFFDFIREFVSREMHRSALSKLIERDKSIC